jgi:hypothetical protein
MDFILCYSSYLGRAVPILFGFRFGTINHGTRLARSESAITFLSRLPENICICNITVLYAVIINITLSVLYFLCRYRIHARCSTVYILVLHYFV